MSDDNLPIITESQFNQQFGGEDLPILTESQFNQQFGGQQFSQTPSIFKNPIDALTSADWWLTRPSGEKISAEQAVVGPSAAALDILTLGLADEITAGGASVLSDKNYDQELAKVRGIQENFSEANPVADVGLRIAAALKNPLVMASKVGQTVGLLPKVGQAIKEGARVGAAFGFGEGEGGAVNRASDALTSGLTSGAISGGLTGATQGVSNIAKNYSGRLTDAADETLEKGLGVQYGERVKGLNKVNLYVDDAGNSVPFDQLDDAAAIQAPIQKQIKNLKESGLLEGAPNDVQGLKLHIVKESAKLGKSIPVLVKQADKVLGNQKIQPSFTQTEKFISGFLPDEQESLKKVFAQKLSAYDNLQGSGLSKLDDFVNKIQKETNFDAATPKAITQLKRFMQYDARIAAEEAFDGAVPSLKGQYAKVNELISASREIGKTLNKPLSRQAPSFGDFIAGGSKPVTAVAAAASPIIGLPAAGMIAGAPILKNAALKYAEAAYPVSMSKAYGSASKGSNSLSEFLRGLPTGKAGNVIASALATAPQDRLSERKDFSNFQSLYAGTNESRSFDTQRTQQPLLEESTTSLNSTPQSATNPEDFSAVQNTSLNSNLGDDVRRQEFDAALEASKQPEVKLTPIPSQLEGLSKKERIKKTSDFVKSQPPLIQAVIMTESSGDPLALSPTGPRGLLQLTKRIGDYYGAKNRWDPKQNVKAGTAFLQDLAEKYTDPKIILSAYNQGETVINKAIRRAGLDPKTADWESIRDLLPTEEGQTYPEKVINNLNKITGV